MITPENEINPPDQQDLRLSGSSLAILGMVGMRGPSTAYDIRRAVGRLSGQFWDVPHAQVYQETKRLEREGLLESTQEQDGRRRRHFRLTAAGREALHRWLNVPDATGMVIRDEAQLQLLFAELNGHANVPALAREQQDVYRRRLAQLAEIEARTAPLDVPRSRTLNLHLGRAVYQAGLDFWKRIEAEEAEIDRPPS